MNTKNAAAILAYLLGAAGLLAVLRLIRARSGSGRSLPARPGCRRRFQLALRNGLDAGADDFG